MGLRRYRIFFWITLAVDDDENDLSRLIIEYGSFIDEESMSINVDSFHGEHVNAIVICQVAAINKKIVLQFINFLSYSVVVRLLEKVHHITLQLQFFGEDLLCFHVERIM